MSDHGFTPDDIYISKPFMPTDLCEADERVGPTKFPECWRFLRGPTATRWRSQKSCEAALDPALGRGPEIALSVEVLVGTLDDFLG